MKLLSTLALLLMTVVSSYAGKPFTFDDVFNQQLMARSQRQVTPLPGTDQYACIEKGKVVAYSFKTGKLVNTLFDINATIGEKISEVSDFILSPDGTKMLIATDVKGIYRHSFTAQWYIYNIQTRKLSRLSDGAAQQAPVWNPTGDQVAFVRDNNIFLVKLLYDNAEIQITKDGKRNAIINGIPDWVNEEEFGFSSSMCFTADGSQLCWLKYDESEVKTYSLQMFKGLAPEHRENSDYPGEYSYKYPKAGQVNSKVTAWAYDTQSRKTQKINLPLDEDGYVCRIYPSSNAESVLLLTLNRHQDNLSIYSANPHTTLCKLIIREQDDKYVPEVAYSNLVITDQHITMLSDRDGNRHIYIYSIGGRLERKVCPEKIDVTEIYGYDEKTGDVYYQAAPTPMTRHIYVSHKNGKVARLSAREGTNDALFSSDLMYYHNTWSDFKTPYVCTSNTNTGKVISTLEDNAKLRETLKGYNLPTKEFFTFTTSEGVTLNGWMMKPADFNASRKYPVIMHQYSGPGSQKVLDSWRSGSMGAGAYYDAYLCQQGFIVVTVDGRGTGCRGAEFEKCMYLNLGVLEAKDQVEAALWLGKQGYVDANHIGIWGWSYGGFNTLMSMSEGRPVFWAGVAIAPPTNWKFYDSIYTERYMRTPRENPDGYAENPIGRASKMHGELLLCHGLADDNVHPQNMFEYTEALVQSDKDFRELIYTNRNHSIYGGNTRKHLLRQVANHFIDALRK